ncbi:MAG: flagellar hook-associated protein 3 [Planctomycetes bacterium]|nr:flagellar hook-associated protein 3 [Planctomycetota bacterium]
MSGALNNIYNNFNFSLQRHAQAIASLQEQVSTGSRINRASDGPSTGYRILGLNSQKRSLGNYMDNISDGMDILEISLTVIDEMGSAISDTKVRLTQIGSGTYGTGETAQRSREGVATGINDILEQIVSSANTERLDQHLFGGSNTSSAPYVVQRSNGEITSVTYQGGLQNRDIKIASGVESSVFYVGDNIFRSNDRSAPVFCGSSGASAGTGTSSVKGDLWLTVTGSAGNWTLSIDDGATTFASDGTETNLAVTNSDGDVLYVDTTAIASTDVEMVRVPGTYDIFNVLINIRDVLRNQRNLSEGTVTDLIVRSADSLGEIKNLLVEQQVATGTKINFMDTLKDSLEKIKFDTEDQTTLLQEADIAQIAIDLSRREILYQMSLSVAGKLMSMSLLDFIR